MAGWGGDKEAPTRRSASISASVVDKMRPRPLLGVSITRRHICCCTVNPTACSKHEDHLILLLVTNRSAKTLKSVSFALHAFESGRSDDLAI
jgi:hypothetical protein